MKEHRQLLLQLKPLVNDVKMWNNLTEYLEDRLRECHVAMERCDADQFRRYQGQCVVYNSMLSLRDTVNKVG